MFEGERLRGGNGNGVPLRETERGLRTAGDDDTKRRRREERGEEHRNEKGRSSGALVNNILIICLRLRGRRRRPTI